MLQFYFNINSLKKSLTAFIDYLLIKEELHERLICMDEAEHKEGFSKVEND